MAAGTWVGGLLLDGSRSGRVAAPFAVLSTLSLIGMLIYAALRPYRFIKGLQEVTERTAA